MDAKPEHLPRDLIERFEHIARHDPERIAITDRHGPIPYGRLNAMANGLAGRMLRDSPGSRSPLIVISADDRRRCIGLLAAWKCGRAFVPLDPAIPAPVLMNTLQSFPDATLLLDDAAHESIRAAAPAASLLSFDDTIESNNPSPGVLHTGDDLAWVIHTSGSTGALKGVMQSRANANHFVSTVLGGLGITASDRIAAASPLTVHAGVVYTLAALSEGALLYMITPTESPDALADRLSRENVTILFTVPTVFRRLAGSMSRHGGLPALRMLRLSGETVTADDVELYRRHTGASCRLSIGLGSTETGGIAHAYIDRNTLLPEGCVPVGTPVDGVEVRLIDDQGHPVRTGEIGEIVAIGNHISPGYVGLPELNETLFTTLADARRAFRTGDLGRVLPDGSLEHLGRKDLQVQIGGRRVELGAIEAALVKLPGIAEAAVIPRQDLAHNTRLVACVVDTEATSRTTGQLRVLLRDLLPDHMIPARFLFLDALPLTPNGKVDRQQIAQRVEHHLDTAITQQMPRNDLEKKLAAIWEDVLGAGLVGIHEDFFELGGDSLSANRIVVRVTEACGVELSLSAVWDAFTVAQMADLVAMKVRAETHPR